MRNQRTTRRQRRRAKKEETSSSPGAPPPGPPTPHAPPALTRRIQQALAVAENTSQADTLVDHLQSGGGGGRGVLSALPAAFDALMSLMTNPTSPDVLLAFGAALAAQPRGVIEALLADAGFPLRLPSANTSIPALNLNTSEFNASGILQEGAAPTTSAQTP